MEWTLHGRFSPTSTTIERYRIDAHDDTCALYPGPAMKVAVVGAGISGVVAGAHLKAAGIDVTVFERSKEAGGVW